MKLVATTLLGCLFLLSAGTAPAAYLISLKNGNSFTTPWYWMDGGKIYFMQYEGQVGFNQNQVQSIHKVPETEGEGQEQANREFYLAQKEYHISKLKGHLDAFNMNLKEGLVQLLPIIQESIQQAQEEILFLEMELKQKNKGAVPQWWTELAVPEIPPVVQKTMATLHQSVPFPR